MARAGGKDTVQRKRSIELYEGRIELAYQHAEKLGLICCGCGRVALNFVAALAL